MTEEEQLAALEADPWFQERPAPIREAIRKYPPWRVYRMKTGNRCHMVSYDENQDGSCTTCMVRVSDALNAILFTERDVFGVPFTDLEPLPDTPEDVIAQVDIERETTMSKLRLAGVGVTFVNNKKSPFEQ